MGILDPVLTAIASHDPSLPSVSIDTAPVSIQVHNNNNLQYYSEVGIGSAGSKFNVIIDTGSDKLWVPSTECVSNVCKAHHQFDPSTSGTFRDLNHQIKMHYGTGAIAARQGTDTVSLGNSKLEKYPIALSVKQSDAPFSSLRQIDGIFGISQTSDFSAMNPEYSFYLSNDTSKAGSLTIGGVDYRHIDPEAEAHVHPTTDPDSWTIDLVDVKVDGQRIGICGDQPCKALIDTGSSLVTAPPADFAAFKATGVHADCSGLGGKSVSLIFRDTNGQEVEYPLTPKEYSIDFQDDHKECKLGFGALDMGPKKWVIGDSFLRRYVASFNKDNHSISFVRSRHDNEDVGVVTRTSVHPMVILPLERAVRQAQLRRIANDFLFN